MDASVQIRLGDILDNAERAVSFLQDRTAGKTACSLAIIFAALTAGAGAPASAQTHVGVDPHGGLYWHVAAPQRADWSLVCRFRPVTYEASQYDKRHWANRLSRQGRGGQAGRLPEGNGRCTLAKTGGPGPVGPALVKNGVATAAGTNDPARPAFVSVL